MIGLVVAMTNETEAILERCSSVKTVEYHSLVFYECKINGVDVVMVKSGIGKVNASCAVTVLIQKYSPTVIISTGIAGGLGVLSPLDVLIVTSTVQHDYDTSPLGDPKGIYSSADKKVSEILLDAYPMAVTGRLASGDQFIADSVTAKKITDEFGAVSCDMEGSAIACVCNLFDVKFGAIKVISDGGNDGAELTFAELADKTAKINAEVIYKTVNRLAEL